MYKSKTKRSFVVILALLVFASYAYFNKQEASDIKNPSMKPIRENIRFLKDRPDINIKSKGIAQVSFETRFNMQNARLYYGVVLEESFIQVPYIRYSAGDMDKTTRSKRDFNFEIDLDDLWYYSFYPEEKQDGDLVVYYVIKIFDIKWNRDRTLEGNFAVRKKGKSFSRVPSLQIGPVVDNITKDSAVISWESDSKDSWMLYLSNNMKHPDDRTFYSGKSLPTPGRNHWRYEVKIERLKPGRLYFYQLMPADARMYHTESAYPLYRFRTQPDDRSREYYNFSFAVLGDSQGGPPGLHETEGVSSKVLRELTQQVFREKAAFAVSLGDLTSGDTDDEADYYKQHEMWYRAVFPVNAYIPFYTVMGNHDMIQDWFRKGTKKKVRARLEPHSSEEMFSSMFVNPERRKANILIPDNTNFKGKKISTKLPEYERTVYSYSYGNSYFIALNSTYADSSIEFELNYQGIFLPNQLRWLENELKHARKQGYKHIFVFTHHPIWPPTFYGNDRFYKDDKPVPKRTNAKRIWNLLNKYKVTAYIAGHHHLFAIFRDRALGTGGTWQIISGSGGASNYPRPYGTPYKMDAGLTRVPHYLLISVENEAVYCTVKTTAGIEIDKYQLR